MNQRLHLQHLSLCVRAALLVAAPLALAHVALAATITVDSTADAASPNPTDGSCTVREAIQAAQTNAAVDSCVQGDSAAADTIVFDASLAGRTISVATDLEITGSLSAGPLVIDGDADDLHAITSVALLRGVK